MKYTSFSINSENCLTLDSLNPKYLNDFPIGPELTNPSSFKRAETVFDDDSAFIFCNSSLKEGDPYV